MKKIAMLLMGVTNLYFVSIYGQNAIGIKGGVNIGNVSNIGAESRLSGHAGVFLHHTINKNWCFQPELLFSGEGFKYFADGFTQTGERTVALSYIQLPLMIQYYPITPLYIEAGPQLGLLISAKDKPDGSHAINVKDQYSTGQVAIGVGLGVKATEEVILYGRYNFGLTDINKSRNTTDHSNVGQVGIAIRLKH